MRAAAGDGFIVILRSSVCISSRYPLDLAIRWFTLSIAIILLQTDYPPMNVVEVPYGRAIAVWHRAAREGRQEDKQGLISLTASQVNRCGESV
jgi:hypothetical protein